MITDLKIKRSDTFHVFHDHELVGSYPCFSEANRVARGFHPAAVSLAYIVADDDSVDSKNWIVKYTGRKV